MSGSDPRRDELAHGLYEQVIDRFLGEQLVAAEKESLVQREPLDEGESHAVLAQHLAHYLQHCLAGIRGPDRLAQQVAVCNRVISLLADQQRERTASDRGIPADARRLMAVLPRQPLITPQPLQRPETPLSASCLLTGTRIDPSLVSQLRKELLNADRVDVLCSFIKWSGVRVLADEFREFVTRPASQLRILTTPYMGATDLKAIDFLSRLPNTEIRISYDTRRTRLHAKAYLFQRDTGFGTAYVGSSNLSNAALTDGLEWNVKISQYESPHLWEKLCGTFESYWNDTEFVPYSGAQRDRLQLALQEQQSVGHDEAAVFQFDIHPYPYQQEILDRLAADRAYHGRSRSLVVAATGTGKTVIAAFDYKQFQQSFAAEFPGRKARLLFVAHREEILKQSRNCFRAVLRDQNFGDLLVGEHRPTNADHVFASIQSLNSRGLTTSVPPDFYDFVIVDEFHHAEAPSYRSLLEYVRPRILLGLTATPERADGLDVLRHFGGHISAEIRLPEAINRKLLCPFQYFGVSDSVDLSSLTWQRGGYVPAELEERYTGNDARADLVVRSVREKLVDPLHARGLGFCVSVAHANYMAGYFQRCGIPAEALSGESPPEVRRTVQQRLVNRDINFIFVVDLYNEGVDIPEVDSLLLLRPTESLTIFLQQLGRGLRLCDGKDCLTVLDFIGQAHRSYNWEMRFRALMDRPRARLDHEIENGCLHVPLGCVIRLERMAQSYVLENIRAGLTRGATEMIRRIARFEEDTGRPLSLANFLTHFGWSIDEIYRRGSWSRLCVRAGVRPDFADPDEALLTKGLRRVAHINSPRLIQRLADLLSRGEGTTLDWLGEQALLMLHVAFWRNWRPDSVAANLDRLRSNPVLHQELLALLRDRFDGIEGVAPDLELPFQSPLELHASYTRDEILVALGCWTLEQQRDVREGVLHLRDLQTDVLFVTLNKTETEYSPTTLYEDFAISEHRFHWQSQSTTSASSPTGQRYIHHQTHGGVILLFVREDKEQNGLACPYDFLGPVLYESHNGSRPMSIIWRLMHAIPARLLSSTKRMASALSAAPGAGSAPIAS
jgi:superfamily II DNA or RNA helicase/HKD family nuclease